MKNFLEKVCKSSIKTLYLLTGKEISQRAPARLGSNILYMQSPDEKNATYKLYNRNQDHKAEIKIQCKQDGSVHLSVKTFETNGNLTLFTTASDRDYTIVYKGTGGIYPVAKNISFGPHLCPDGKPTRNVATLKYVFAAHGITL